MKLIKTANQLLHGVNIEYDNSVSTTKNERFQKYMQSMPVDVDDSEHVGLMFATRTKPAMNTYQQKRLGAKKAKKLKIATNSSFVLSPSDAKMYRALAA